MPEHLTIEPIGILRSPYTDKYDAPRQPAVDGKRNESVITLYPHRNYEQALEDLAGFERVWIVSWFHRNAQWKPKVLPPRSGRTKRGVFATRSPHRPNPIGLSVCELVKIKGLRVYVRDVDLLDETPILDIKPYIPYADSFPDSRIGWLAEAEANAQVFEIMLSDVALAQLDWLEAHSELNLRSVAFPVLRRDPFPYSSRRIVATEEGYCMAVKSWRIHFQIQENNVHIERIASGYSKEYVFVNPEGHELNDHSAHRGFYQLWE